MRCVTCHQEFDFAAGQTAVVLRHVAYGYDFVHPGICEERALRMIFVEPGFDSAAFAHDAIRARVLAVLGIPGQSEVHAVIENRDGSRQLERISRDPEWADEPGAAEFARQALAYRAELVA
jgi:hypothetical protein